ncbi:hypothetical protein GCM10011487_12020 [Steroidobacter agaridevorans]|uniref:VRR-NUC domain-containing protein n=1 Tax=Steroidobacter agaridevorans TaxID=2695856 RepID=A0A829Y9D7_9GAMM|nr:MULTISPECIES: VRR-NUC domain-containing protein [Steroidobacteraceae]GFE79202.1 hypothetical protein GCM10011487_12020 [Steroidobacter agaridevorans]
MITLVMIVRHTVRERALDETTLQLALQCIPAEHLTLYFTQMLEDLSENTHGFADLVQSFPEARTNNSLR